MNVGTNAPIEWNLTNNHGKQIAAGIYLIKAQLSLTSISAGNVSNEEWTQKVAILP